MGISVKSNPFESLRATDFSDQEIFDFWVGLVGEVSLEEVLSPASLTPMVVLGGKGSGKTHLMRYFSASVQRLNYDKDLSRAVSETKYLGVYVWADGLKVNRFREKGYSDQIWNSIFYFYFELRLAINLLRDCLQVIQDGGLEYDSEHYSRSFSDLLVCDGYVGNSLEDSISYLMGLRKGVDRIVANVATGRATLDEVQICFNPGDMVFGLPLVLKDCCRIFSDMKFIFMIDELENFSSGQQEFLNSLIRYRKGPVSFRVGARLYGIKTNSTIEGGEPIKLGSEYVQVNFERAIRDAKSQDHFFKALIIKRLENSGFRPPGSNVDPSDYFEDTSSEEDVNSFLLKISPRNRDKEYGHTIKFRRNLAALERSGIVSSADIEEIIGLFKFPESPLKEKLCYLSFYKEWGPTSEALDLARRISADCRASEMSATMRNRFGQFKSDLISQYVRESTGKRVYYYGLSTLIDVCQNTPRNLFIILRSVYRRARFNGESPFDGESRISIRSQSEGVLDASEWFWEDAQPDVHGKEVRDAVDRLGRILMDIRYSSNPPECAVSTITFSPDGVSALAKDNLRHALNWSYLYSLEMGGIDKNKGSQVNNKVQLGPMLAPKYGLPPMRRGCVHVESGYIDELFSGEIGGFSESMKDRVNGFDRPFGKFGSAQDDLFVNEDK